MTVPSDIILRSGDLIEYTREMKGDARLPEEMTVRAVVRGFEVQQDDETGETSVGVWLFEGASQIGAPEEQGQGTTVRDARWDRPRELLCLGLEYVLSLDPVVISPGNSPRDMQNFEIRSSDSEGI